MSWIDRRLKKFVCGSLKKVSGKEGFEDSSIYPPRRLDAPEDLGSDKKVFIINMLHARGIVKRRLRRAIKGDSLRWNKT
jgi:hypothetical protein